VFLTIIPVKLLPTDLNLRKDIAGATFMALATSAPELCVNVIGTFLTESDLGIGTVVGSAVFNTLGVAACGGLAATSVSVTEKPIYLYILISIHGMDPGCFPFIIHLSNVHLQIFNNPGHLEVL
jgi:Ca2+/Na+ antiporter